MALSESRLGANMLWGESSGDLGSIQSSHQKITILEKDASIDPKTLTPEAFRELNGYMQEDILLSLLSVNDLDRIADLRKDLEPHKDVSGELKTVSYLAGEVARDNFPITPPSGASPRSDIAQLHALCYPISEDELVAKLQRERERAESEFPNAFFAPAEDIGPFSAPRRYFATLVMALDKNHHYSRDFFRPLEPSPLPENPSNEQKERYRRALAAHDLYLREIELPGELLT